MRKPPSGLPCPEVWIDPEILPLVTLLNRLGFETVWSCAGFGTSRSRVEPPLARIPPKIRRLVQSDGENWWVEQKAHLFCNTPYVTFRWPDPEPEWIAGVMRHLRHATMGDNDLWTDRFVDHTDVKLVNVGQIENGEVQIGMAKGASSIIGSLGDVSVCRNDIVTIKRMWLHEMTKAFGFV